MVALGVALFIIAILAGFVGWALSLPPEEDEESDAPEPSEQDWLQ